MTDRTVPRVSVVTASAKSNDLDRTLLSLRAQRLRDWEWIVVTCQGANWQPPANDERIRVIEASSANVAAAKAQACVVASGQILLELNEGERLTSDALAEVVRVFDDRPAVGFVYSHSGEIAGSRSDTEDYRDPSTGWRYRSLEIDGQSAVQRDSFDSSPHNVSWAWYCPGQIRAFRRDIYEAVGGYDVDRGVFEGEDLTCRLFQKTEFHLIGKCLCLATSHHRPIVAGSPPVELDHAAVALYDQNIQPNALAWSSRKGLTALDLGAAHSKPEGYLGVDQYEGPGVDIIADVSLGLDLADSSVGVIRASDFLEHVPDKIALFNEIYRLLSHGGMLLSMTPSTDGRGAYQDPTHVAFYNENSFWYFTQQDYARFVPSIKCRFQVSRMVTYFPSPWHRDHGISYVNANLVAIKDGPRQGGKLLI